MTDKERADIGATLAKHHWDNFDRRRSYEWKLSLGVWTALAAFVGVLLTKDAIVILNNALLTAYGMLALPVVLVLYYKFRIKISNDSNKLKEEFL